MTNNENAIIVTPPKMIVSQNKLLSLKLILISNNEQGISNIKRNSESSTEQALKPQTNINIK